MTPANSGPDYRQQDAYLLARLLMLRVYAATHPDQLSEAASLERVASEELTRRLRHEALLIPMTWITGEGEEARTARRIESALATLDSDLATASGDGLLSSEVAHQLRELARRVHAAVH